MTSKKKMKEFDKELRRKFDDGAVYSITIAPDNKRQYIHKGLNRFVCVREKVIELLQGAKFVNHIKYLNLFPDVARGDILSVSRIHWHGWLQFENVRAFTLCQHEIDGLRIEIDSTDDNFSDYMKYCTKWIRLYPEDEMYKIEKRDLETEPMHIETAPKTKNILSELKRRDKKNTQKKLMQEIGLSDSE